MSRWRGFMRLALGLISDLVLSRSNRTFRFDRLKSTSINSEILKLLPFNDFEKSMKENDVHEAKADRLG